MVNWLGRYLGFRYLYPKYPLQLVVPKGSEVRFGTRDVFVDVPAEIYVLYALERAYRDGSSKGRKVSRKYIKSFGAELNKRLGKYSGLYRVIYCSRKRPYVRLLIRWDKLIEYLNDKVSSYAGMIRQRDGKGAVRAVRDLYWGEIIGNYLRLISYGGCLLCSRRALINDHNQGTGAGFRLGSGSSLSCSGEGLAYQRQCFRRILMRLGELEDLRGLKEELVGVANAVLNELVRRCRQLNNSSLTEVCINYCWALADLMALDINNLFTALSDDIDTNEAMLHLRRSIERFVRLLMLCKELKGIRRDNSIEELGERLTSKFYERVYVRARIYVP